MDSTKIANAPTLEESGDSLAIEELLADPCWSQALDLGERLDLRRLPKGESPCDAELAARRLGRWLGQPPFGDDPGLWERRLAAAALGEAELLALLGESPEVLATRAGARAEGCLPWLAELRAAYGASTQGCEPLPWPAAARRRFPFLTFAEPLVRRARARLLARADELCHGASNAPLNVAGADALLAHLPDLLAPLLNRTLVVELQIARLEERLEGETPEERFDAFLDHLGQGENALEVLARYPELARRLVERVGQWEEACGEFLERLVVDADAIREHFGARDTVDRLVEARGAVSDAHRGGRGVFLLRFASGFRLVYKPRSLAVENTFQHLLSWLEQAGYEPALRTLRILERSEYGWMEWAGAAPCSSRVEVRRFYRRQGGLLALFYLLEGSDFHYENLIAAGEYPLPVDLEVLFHPWLEGRSLRGLEHLPGTSLHATVMRSNLLPNRLWATRRRGGVDLSGLGAREGQLTPQEVLATTERGTDAMRVERRRVEIPVSENLPRIDGAEISLLDYTEDLRAGFGRMYDLLCAHREALAADDGPLAAFAGTQVRVLCRPTAAYVALLLESYHPHLLGNALDRQRFLDHLWGIAEKRPFMEPLVPAEQADLAGGDIPYFTTRPESRDVWTSSGERLSDFFEDSGLERARRRLLALSPDDRTRQDDVICKALETVRLSTEECPRTAYDFRERAEPVRRAELLSAARMAADRLVLLAFQKTDEALWLTVEHREPEGWSLNVTGPDLYQGLPGIALFLGYLGKLTGEESYTRVARRAAAILEHQVEENPSALDSIGAFSGWGGVIYTLTHLAVLWEEQGWLDRAAAHAERLAPQVASDENLDLVGGSAGCLMALLGLESLYPSERQRATARACGERLLAAAEPQPAGGLGWPLALTGPRALAGMSHGAAGISLGLLQLAQATGDERFRRTALGGIELERGLYDATEGNWPDLRAGAADGLHGGEHFMCAWCHGAPGIGLARVGMLPLLEDLSIESQGTGIRDEIGLAIRATLEGGFGSNHSLCHGDLGNLCFLLDAAHALGDTELDGRVGRLAGGVVDSIAEDGWLFGLKGNLETPGLMVGLAGIGYALAYLAAPERLPSILRLAPPPEG